MLHYIKDYERAIKYQSLETIKGLASHEEPATIAHIMADAVEDYGHPTLAKYLRKAWEDRDHPNHPYKKDAFTFFSSSNARAFTGENGYPVLEETHQPGVALSSVRNIIPEWLGYNKQKHVDNDMYVSHDTGYAFGEDNTPLTESYLNITFKRHDGSHFHIRHRGTLEEHVKDLQEMAKEGMDGAEDAFRQANAVHEYNLRVNKKQT